MLGEFLARLRFFISRKRPVDLDDELQFHLEQSTQANIAAGMTREEARRQAAIAFGGVQSTRQQCYEQRPGWPLETAMHDMRYSLRGFRRHPIFALTVIATLTLGVGVTTVVFTILDSVLLRALPYPNAQRVVRVWNTFAPRGMMEIPASEPEFLEYRQSRSFAHFAGFSSGAVTLSGSRDPVRIAASWGTPDFFAVLGNQPILGRVFSADEYQPGHTQVAVLSYRLWEDRFGSDPAITGRSILLNDQSYIVVGVMPRDFKFPSADIDVWQPLPIAPGSTNLDNHYLNLFGELGAQATLNQARSEMTTIAGGTQRKYPAYYGGATGIGVSLVPLREQMVGKVRPAVLVLMVGAGFMLLIACTNVANLLVAHGEERKLEFATRTALGAARWRIVNQVLIENVPFFLAGGAFGVLFALLCLKILSIGDYFDITQLGGVAVDLRVLTFAAIVCLLTGLLFGLVPALKASQSNLNDALKAGGRDTMGSRDRGRTRSLMVSSQIAFSLVLVTGAGLMISSFAHLLGVSLGFNSQNVVSMRLSLPDARYPWNRVAAFYEQLQEKVRGLPGVQAVAIVNQLPMSDPTTTASFDVEGRPSNTDINVMDAQIISPDYFRVMQIPLLSGRLLNEYDAQAAPRPIIVNQTLARKVWPTEGPLGKRIRLRPDAPWLSVVGTVADIKNHGSSADTRPEMYFLYSGPPFGLWADFRSMTLVVRTTSDPQSIVGAIRAQLKDLDADLPIYKVQTLREMVSSSLSQTRFPALLLSLFAGLALILAAVGVYGVLAYVVAQRRHEIGVRTALGAGRGQILVLFLGQGVKWAAMGGSVGLFAAFMLVRFMRSMLFQVGPYDPGIFLTGSVVLATVVLLACYIPAVGATRVDPSALRSQ
jgi:predicted permease